MTTQRIDVSTSFDWAESEDEVERCCLAAGLRVSLKATLAKYPGCVHWHFKRGDEPGTLEITVWPTGRRAWCSVQSGRRAAWIDRIMPVIIRDIEARTGATK
jgi:hypothetical protein